MSYRHARYGSYWPEEQLRQGTPPTRAPVDPIVMDRSKCRAVSAPAKPERPASTRYYDTQGKLLKNDVSADDLQPEGAP